MFKESKKKRAEEDVVMEKVLALLSDTKLWVKNDISYSHMKSDLVISWGTETSWTDSYKVRRISQPESLIIPYRYRKKFLKLLEKIENKKENDTPMSFLNSYLDGEYVSSLKVEFDESKSTKIKKWLRSNNISSFYIKNKTEIWFKKEEDAVAFKLRWL